MGKSEDIKHEAELMKDQGSKLKENAEKLEEAASKVKVADDMEESARKDLNRDLGEDVFEKEHQP